MCANAYTDILYMFTLMEIELYSSYYCMIFHFFLKVRRFFMWSRNRWKTHAPVSHGCYNKSLQTCWLKNTRNVSHSSPCQKSKMSCTKLKSRCWQDHIPSEAPGIRYSLPLPASGSCWHSCHLILQFLPLWSCCLLICHCQISFSASFLQERTLWCHSEPTQIILINLPIQDP